MTLTFALFAWFVNVQSIVCAAALATDPTPAKLTLFASVSTVAATASPAPLTHEIDSSVHCSSGSSGLVTPLSVIVKSECPTRNAWYEAMDPFLSAPTPVGVMVWLKEPSWTQPDTAVPSGAVDEAVAPAGASTASWVALEVKVADGWVEYVRPPSVVMTLWMRT